MCRASLESVFLAWYVYASSLGTSFHRSIVTVRIFAASAHIFALCSTFGHYFARATPTLPRLQMDPEAATAALNKVLGDTGEFVKELVGALAEGYPSIDGACAITLQSFFNNSLSKAKEKHNDNVGV